MSWVQYPADHPFPVQNLPYGCAVLPGKTASVPVIAIGDFVVDLQGLSKFFSAETAAALNSATLNAFMALDYTQWAATRDVLVKLFSNSADANPALRDDAELQKAVMHKADAVQMVLPADIGDYTDFYASREHATNLGKMFRPDSAPLLENWLHIPVGYHGRSSSIVVSGTPLTRPHGQTRPDPTQPPIFGPCRLCDFELEMATYIGTGNKLGTVITTEDARKKVFGFSVFNDWSARDIQKWEYVPLGPFLGKNFGSTISPWIVTTFAMEPFLVAGPKQDDPTPLPYLHESRPGNYDVELSVTIKPKSGESKIVTQSNWKYMYWSVYQQLAHHSINGCNMRPGDVIASGTISGPEAGSYGSMLEICWQGTKPIQMPDGSERKMIADGDTVIMTGVCKGDGYVIGFGEASSEILPAIPMSF